MKKLVAILLLALMVFNLTGYRFVFNYLENRAEAKMAEKLDNNAFNRANLIEVKVALHLPYTTNNRDFERYDGSVELDGVTYSYVERKVENDTLVLHCLPDGNSDNIKHAQNDYSKAVNDIQPSQKGQKANNSSLLLKSLVCAFKMHNSHMNGDLFFTVQLAAYKTTSEKIIDDRFAKSPEQPPDAA